MIVGGPRVWRTSCIDLLIHREVFVLAALPTQQAVLSTQKAFLLFHHVVFHGERLFLKTRTEDNFVPDTTRAVGGEVGRVDTTRGGESRRNGPGIPTRTIGQGKEREPTKRNDSVNPIIKSSTVNLCSMIHGKIC